MYRTPKNDEFDIADVDAALAAEKAEPTDKPASTKKRKKMFAILALVVLKAGAGWYAYDWLHSGTVETDNAYVGADTASITPLVSGHVARVLVLSLIHI